MFSHYSRRRLPALACTIVVALAGCASGDLDQSTVASASSGNAAPAPPCEESGPEGVGPEAGGPPALKLPCLGDGPDVSLGALTGRPTLINLWASWCAPCREEMPLLQQAFAEDGQVVRFLGVVTRDDPAIAADFASETGVTYPHAVDADGTLLTELGVPGLPVTLALDPTGRIMARQIGQMTSAELSSLMEQLKASANR